MIFEAFITRAADGREVDFERDFEREPVIQIARTLYEHFSQVPKYYALLANLSLPTGKAKHVRQIDALLLSEDGIGVLDFKNAHASFTPSLDDRPWLYTNQKTVKAGKSDNPFRQIEAQRYSVYLALQNLPQFIKHRPLPKPFLQHAQRSLKSRKSNKHFHHFEIAGRVVLTGKKFELPPFKREKHQRWFDIIWMDECADFAQSISFNKGMRLSPEVIRVMIDDLFMMSPWIELESLYRKPYAYLRFNDDSQPIPLLHTSATLGRSSDLAVRIDPNNKHISRRHAIIRQTPAGSIICDAGSTNGTWINGIRLQYGQEWRLHHEDVITLGKLQNNVPDAQSVQLVYLNHLDSSSSANLPEFEETVGIEAIDEKMLCAMDDTDEVK